MLLVGAFVGEASGISFPSKGITKSGVHAILELGADARSMETLSCVCSKHQTLLAPAYPRLWPVCTAYAWVRRYYIQGHALSWRHLVAFRGWSMSAAVKGVRGHMHGTVNPSTPNRFSARNNFYFALVSCVFLRLIKGFPWASATSDQTWAGGGVVSHRRALECHDLARLGMWPAGDGD